MRFFVVLIYLWNIFLSVDANAMLKPTHRGMMWTRGSYNSAGYNYMGINCGGIGRLKNNGGKCGLCGDAFNGPRNHETGGKYSTGAIADVIDRGQRNIHVKVLLNSDQGGYFEFKLCASNGTAETQACFNKHLLKISEGRLQGDAYTYYVHRAGIIPLTIEVPDSVYCDKCVLQWKYVTGNTFGRDEHGVGCLGCGHQETYVNCADITIKGWEIAITTAPPTTPIPSTMAWTTTTVAPTTTPAPTTRAPTTPAPTTPAPTTRAPTTRAPSTTAPRMNRITKVRQTKSTQPVTRYATKQRRPVTDFDEGSRRRMGYAVNPNVYSPVPAPVKAPAPKPKSVVPASVFRSKSVNIAQNQLKAPVKSPVVGLKTPDKVKPKNVVSLPKKRESHKPVYRTKKRSGPFKIPRPPRLSSEQIDALNNNKNVVPHHDPLQKYVKVGSSSLIAAVDFTTLRAQQVQTPPTIPIGSKSKKQYSASEVTTPAKGLSSGKQNVKSVDVYSSFDNEMMGSSTNTRKSNFGGNLMNEYGVLPENTPNGSQQKQRNAQSRNNQNHMVSFLNEFAGGNTNMDGTRQISQTFGISEPTTKGPRGNPYFSYDRYNSMTPIPKQSHQLQTNQHNQNNNMIRTPSSKPLQQTQSAASPKSSMYGEQHQLSKNRFMYNDKHQTFSPANPNAGLVPEADMFGSSISRNPFGYNKQNQNSFNVGSQNSVNVGSESRYGKMMPNERLGNTQHPSHQDMNQVNWMQENNNQIAYRPTKTTKLPVIDTSTHQVKGVQAENIASWRKMTLNPSSNLNGANFQDKPVNLFKNKKRNSFKAPVVFERFTQFKVGGSRKKPKAVPKELIKANQFWHQENVLSQNTGISNASLHLNTDIHSPQTYFGQDHYIAHDVEISNPAFGGPKTQDVISQQALDLGQHEIAQADSGTQSYNDVNLNAGLHSPTNYFPHNTPNVDQTIPTSRNIAIPKQQHIGTYKDLNIEKLFVKASPTQKPTTTKQPSTTTTTQASTTQPSTARTTNALDYQMQELKKLRERMERLQRLIEMRQGGLHSVGSTMYSPTQSPTDIHSQQENTASQSQIDVQRSFNKNLMYATQQNINSDKNWQSQQNTQNTNLHQHNDNMPISNANVDRHELTKPSTVSPGMTKETTRYINHFKTQMLQSIKKANAQRNQQVTPTPASFLRNKENNIYNMEPYNVEKTTYVTPSRHVDVQRSDHNILNSQGQPQVQRVQEQQHNKQTNSADMLSMRERQDQDRRKKYRLLFEILNERRKQKKLASKQEQQNTFNEKQQNVQSSQQYNTNKQQNVQSINQQQLIQQNQEQMTNNFDNHNPYQQSFQQKPMMAEVQTQSFKKQRIMQDKQRTSTRPAETIKAPNTASSISNRREQHVYKPKAVKTTIDKLADKLAAGMTEQLNSVGHNFHVLPLSSNSVMSALRNIAANVLQSQGDQTNTPRSANSNTDSFVGQTQYPFEKPSLSEMQVTNHFQKQKTVNANDLAMTKVTKKVPVMSTAKQTTQRRGQSGRHSNMSKDRLKRRQELIRKMKEMMLRRRQKLKMNTKTKTDYLPPYLPKSKLPHSGQRDTVNNVNQRSHGDTFVQNIVQPNDIKQVYNYNDPSTTTKNYSSSTSYDSLQRTPQHITDTHSSSQIPATSSTSLESVYSNNKPNVDKQSKLRLSPDIAQAMLSRVRNMLTRKNSQPGGYKEVSTTSAQGMSAKDVLVMPLKRETLLKLLQSMRKQKMSSGR